MNRVFKYSKMFEILNKYIRNNNKLKIVNGFHKKPTLEKRPECRERYNVTTFDQKSNKTNVFFIELNI